MEKEALQKEPLPEDIKEVVDELENQS